MADEEEKKERVLHTRVPAVLEQELKRLAKNLRVPVSNVVRAILEDALDTVDVVGQRAEGELRSVAERLHRERGRLRTKVVREEDIEDGVAIERPAAPLAGVVGFQSMLLARDHRCALCGRAMSAGDEAFLGVREHAGPKVIVGRECLPVQAGRAGPQNDEGETT